MGQAGTAGTKNAGFYNGIANIEAVPKVKFSVTPCLLYGLPGSTVSARNISFRIREFERHG
jgi:hypothetical protein